jgi:predicted nucleic acid-binding protein
MAFLFDTDAISETMRLHPHSEFLAWVGTIPLGQQFTSAVVAGELLRGVHLRAGYSAGSEPDSRSQGTDAARLTEMVDDALSRMTVIPFDIGTARVFGLVSARLQSAGMTLALADLQIAATALHYGLELVTGNVRHFERVPGLRINRSLIEARGER